MAWIDQAQPTNCKHASVIAVGVYVLGCLTTGYYSVRLRTDQDIRDIGSGSVGARNVGRVLGWPAFWVTLLGDFAKGVAAVWVAQHFTTDYRLVALALIAVVVGHVWPAQLRFHGGNGIPPSLGGLFL